MYFKVGGVHGCVDHVVRHVVVDRKSVPEVAPILHLAVDQKGVLAQVLLQNHVNYAAVLVRLQRELHTYIHVNMYMKTMYIAPYICVAGRDIIFTAWAQLPQN